MKTVKSISNRINISLALIEQVAVIILSFVTSRLILSHYGSSANGLVQSVTKFLSIVTLLDGGFGTVVRAAFYKPLSNKDKDQLNDVYYSSQSIFSKVGLFSGIYLLFLTIFFKFISGVELNWIYCVFLVLSLGFSTIVEYLFGITNTILLKADKQFYKTSIIAISVNIANLLFTIICVNANYSLISLYFMIASTNILKTLGLQLYIRKHYAFHKPEIITPLPNRWDSMAQHIAFVIHSSTDTVLLTFFSTMEYVSVYSVYSLVVTAIGKLFKALSAAIHTNMGRLYAANKIDRLQIVFKRYFAINTAIATVIYGCTSLLIVQFVLIYSKNVTDVNYSQPKFALLLCLAEFIYCLRLPFSTVTTSAGILRETRNGSIYEAVINIVISIILIKPLGLVGVAIGTVVAMTVRTVDFAHVAVKMVLRGCGSFIALVITINSIVYFTITITGMLFMQANAISLIDWIRNGAISTLSVMIIVLAANYLCVIEFRKSFLSINMKGGKVNVN